MTYGAFMFDRFSRARFAALTLALGAVLSACSTDERPSGDAGEGGTGAGISASSTGGTAGDPPQAGMSSAPGVDHDAAITEAIPAGNVFTGDFIVSDADSIARLADYHEITGSLTVRENRLEVLSLPALVTVGGRIEIDGNTSLTRIELPALRSASSIRINGHEALEELDLSGLQTLSDPDAYDENGAPINSLTSESLGALTVTFSTLTSIDLPKLTQGGLVVANCWELMHINAPQLETALNVAIAYGNVPLTLELPQLREIERHLQISYAQLAKLDLPELERIGGGVRLYNNSAIESVSAPKLGSIATGVNSDADYLLRIVSHSALTRVELPMLTTVDGFFEIASNPMLSSCAVAALLAQVEGPFDSRTTGNDESAVCE
jgi:hypothetical protein